MKYLPTLLILTGFWSLAGCDSEGTAPAGNISIKVTYVSFDSVRSEGERDCFALSGDGSTVIYYTEPVSFSKLGTIKIWNAQTGALKNTISVDPNKYRITRLELSDDGSNILGYQAYQKKMATWNANGTFLSEGNGFYDAHMLGEGPDIAGLTHEPITDKWAISIVTPTNTSYLSIPLLPGARFIGVDQTGRGVVIQPDTSKDVIVIWNAYTDTEVRSFSMGHAQNGGYYLSKNILAAAGPTTIFFDLLTGNKIRELSTPPLKWNDLASDRAFTQTKFVHSNQDTLSNSHVSIHDMTTTNEIYADSSRPYRISWSKYSKDEKTLAIGGRFLKVLLFN